MKYLSEVKESDRLTGIYLCTDKQNLKARSGSTYLSIKLQDKTSICDGKIWDVNSNIGEFKAGDYIKIEANVVIFQGHIQLNIQKLRKTTKEDVFDPADYIPSSKYDIEQMYAELLTYIDEMDDQWLKRLAGEFFIFDKKIVEAFKKHSAAKTVHHNFCGGLLEHSLGMVRLSKAIADKYPIINRSLLYLGAMLHDIGKLKELSDFPVIDYTDEGQLVGHIVIGSEWVSEKIREIDNFPKELELILKHMILAHHGEFEYGSPKKPATLEAMVLHYVDNIDAKVKMFEMAFDASDEEDVWLGYNRFLTTNIRRSTWEE